MRRALCIEWIHVRLRGEVHDRVYTLLPQQPLDERGVADVALNEPELLARSTGSRLARLPA